MPIFYSPIPRGIESKFPGERGMKIRPIPRGIGDGDPRGRNPIMKAVRKGRKKEPKGLSTTNEAKREIVFSDRERSTCSL